jgi:hypothetical protein
MDAKHFIFHNRLIATIVRNKKSLIIRNFQTSKCKMC